MSYQGAGAVGSVASRAIVMPTSRTSIRYDPRDFNTQDSHGEPRAWRSWKARRSRYAIQWAHYEGSLYDDINSWLEALKNDKALYEFVRHIYSPANRLGEFWATHIFGGALDPDAGTGFPTRSAIPILEASDAMRKAIAGLWKDSNWQVHKETIGRFGSVMGDVGITVVDDPRREMVKLEVVDPRHIFDIDEDRFGNCRGYILKRLVPDPEYDGPVWGDSVEIPEVEYTEICSRRGDLIVYETFRDGIPYDWANRDLNGRDSRSSEWTEDYGFVPFVRIQHKDIGVGYGMSEFSPALLSKLYELDDQASKFGDYVRRAVDSPWLFSGVDMPEENPNPRGPRRKTQDSSQEARLKMPTLYATDPNARAQALIANLDLPAVLENIRSILRVIEQEHPELTADLALATGDASGRALRVAKEKAEALVVQRRATYDDALCRAHKMAVSIGGLRGYPAYSAFNANSYKNGDLDHQIGQRPVFAMTAWEMLEEELERANVVKTLTDAGVPLETAWTRAGYSEKEITAMLAARDREVEFQLKRIQVMQKEAANDGANYGLQQ